MNNKFRRFTLAAVITISFLFQPAPVLAQSDGFNTSEILVDLLPAGSIIPSKLPSAISDPILMTGWVYLYNQEEPFTGWDGSTHTGRELAQYVIDARVTVRWNTTGKFDGRSYVPRSGARTTGRNKSIIYISTEYQDPALVNLAELAGTLAHEIFHHQLPFGNVKDTLYEEYWAFWTGTQISNTERLDFEGYNSHKAACLNLWFGSHQLKSYAQLALYPAAVEPQADLEDSNCELIRRLPGEVSGNP